MAKKAYEDAGVGFGKDGFFSWKRPIKEYDDIRKLEMPRASVQGGTVVAPKSEENLYKT